MSQKGGKRPKWKVIVHEVEVREKKAKSEGYQVSPNYKGKKSMTRTQWRCYQRNKKATREASISQVKPVKDNNRVKDMLPTEATKPIEFPIPKVYYPKSKLTEKRKSHRKSKNGYEGSSFGKHIIGGNTKHGIYSCA